jgi:FixJ family two-component response regulator
MKNNSATARPAIAVIDDDAAMRDSIEFLLRSVRYNTIGLDSAAAFGLGKLAYRPSCLVVDVRLPGVSGLDFQAQLADAGINVPIIFVTGRGDIPMASRAMKAGEIDFLTRPFRNQDLLDTVAAAIERDRASTERETTKIYTSVSFRLLGSPRAGSSWLRGSGSYEQADRSQD